MAGLSASIHLARSGLEVLVLEKNKYPTHKVCGEYLSREVVPYLHNLGIDLSDSPLINRLEISGTNGEVLSAPLPLGGIGISRYALDHRIYKCAVTNGVSFVFEPAIDISSQANKILVKTSENNEFLAPIVIGAHGKRSSIDKTLKRSFMDHKAPWLGVKAHYDYKNFPSDLVGLHSFPGGYGGLSMTETGAINFCYLANYKNFKKYGDIELFNEKVVSQNPILKNFLESGELLFDKPLTIAQISFDKKDLIENNIIMCGDAAGLIHPLCGNGMAMAIRSAEILSICILRYFEENNFDRAMLELNYSKAWKKEFRNRLWWGRQLQSLLLNQTLSSRLVHIFTKSERLTKAVIRKTHGKLLHT